MVSPQVSCPSNISELGFPLIDLFASAENHQTQTFCSRIPHPEALALDAPSISWEKMFGYAYPSICLIPKVLQHISQFQCQIILIAPRWPRRHWYTQLLQPLVACPRKLRHTADSLLQHKALIHHPNPEVFSLHAWLLLTEMYKRKAFLASIKKCYQHPGGQGHRKIMPANSTSYVAFVVQFKLIPILPL